MRGAVVSMEVAVVGFPGVEPSDKFLIEAIEELLPVVSAFFTWKAGAAFLAPKDGIMAERALKGAKFLFLYSQKQCKIRAINFYELNALFYMIYLNIWTF